LTEAARLGIRPDDQKTAKVITDRKRRAVKERIANQRDGATRLRMSRRAEIRRSLATALKNVRHSCSNKDNNDLILKEAFSATCGRAAKQSPRNAVERATAARQMPLRLILDFGNETCCIKDAADRLSKDLGTRLDIGGDSLPGIDAIFRGSDQHRYFVLTLPLSWDKGSKRRFVIAAAIKQRTRLASVQPSERLSLKSGSSGFSYPPERPPYPLDTQWPLRTMKVFEAWALELPDGGAGLGAGETIGHLDSGWFDHPEYDENRIDKVQAYNALTGAVGETAAKHTYPPEGGNSESHGLATGAMMVSAVADEEATTVGVLPAKAGDPAEEDLQITGVAPDAFVLPVRCLDSVAIVSDTVVLAQGAEYLIGTLDYEVPAKVGVISMSFGGLTSSLLKYVLNIGVQQKDVIAIAAAGQNFIARWAVTSPANYPEVIAVAASRADGAPTDWTFAGPEIDWAAPGENVWVAGVRGEEQSDGTSVVNRYINYSSGTSFSCALSAGVAALWRAFYRTQLAASIYDDIPMAHIFKQHVRNTCDVPDDWDTSQFGRGIIDVEALLSTPLPTPEQIPVPPSTKPFNPFSGLDATSTTAIQTPNRTSAVNSQGLVGLQSAAADLGQQLAKGGADKWNEGFVVLSTLVDGSDAMARTALAIGLSAAEKMAKANSDFIADRWDEIAGYGADFSSEIGAKASALAEDFSKAWEDAAEEAEETGEAAAEATEEAVEDIIETVEDIVEETSEAAEEVVEWICGLVC